jgi:hypothetical protein
MNLVEQLEANAKAGRIPDRNDNQSLQKVYFDYHAEENMPVHCLGNLIGLSDCRI